MSELNSIFKLKEIEDEKYKKDPYEIQTKEKRLSEPSEICIALDVDGVIRDFPHQMVKVFLKHYPQYKDQVQDPDLWTKWELENNFPIGYEIYNFMTQEAEEIFYDAPIIPGAIDGFKILKKVGFKLIIISKQDETTGYWTLEWINKVGIKPEEIYFEEDKHKMINYFDYIVEDNSRNIINIHEAGGRPIVFDHLYNRTSIPLDIEQKIHRVYDWKELVYYFLEPHAEKNHLINKILRGWK